MGTEGLTIPASVPAPVLIADLRRQLTDYEPEDATSMTAESIRAVLDSFAITHEALALAAVDAGHALRGRGGRPFTPSHGGHPCP
jgi:hypothetical protein